LLARGFVGWVECNESQRFSNIITSSQARKYGLFVGRSLGRKKRENEFTTESTEALRVASRLKAVVGVGFSHEWLVGWVEYNETQRVWFKS